MPVDARLVTQWLRGGVDQQGEAKGRIVVTGTFVRAEQIRGVRAHSNTWYPDAQ